MEAGSVSSADAASSPEHEVVTDIHDFNIEFVQMYKQCRALWDPAHPGYKLQRLRDVELDKMLVLLKTIQPNATREHVKRKINCLRTNYNRYCRVHKKNQSESINLVEDDSCNEEDGKRRKTIYDYLTFLSDVKIRKNRITAAQDDNISFETSNISPRPTKMIKTNNLSSRMPELYPIQSVDIPNIYYNHSQGSISVVEEEEYLSDSMYDIIVGNGETPQRTINRKIKFEEPKYNNPQSSRTKEETHIKKLTQSIESLLEVDPLTIVWTNKLKKLNPTQRLYAEKAINDVLFKAQLKNLANKPDDDECYEVPSSPSEQED